MRAHGAKAAVLLCSAALLVISASSCRREPQGRCGNLAKDLNSPSKAKEAIRGLGQFKVEAKDGAEVAGPKTCAKVIPELLKMYKDGRYRADILMAVKQMGRDETIMASETLEMLKLALADPEGAPIAASLVEDWKLRELKDDVIKNLRSKDFGKIRLTVFKALLAIAEPKDIEDLLIELAVGDPEKQNMQVNVMAVQRLGMIKSQKGLPSMVKTIFLRDQRGGRMYQAARRAIVMVGKAAVQPLLDTINGVNQDVKDYAQANGIPDWEWSEGQEIMELLGDLAYPEASLDVAKNLAKPLTEPARLSDKQLEMWKISQSNRIKLGMITLGTLGPLAPAGVELLKQSISNEEYDIQQRLDSAMAMALVGCPGCVDALLEVFTSSTKPTFKAALLEPLSFAMDWAHIEGFDKAIAAETSDLVKKKLEEGADMSVAKFNLDVVRNCKGEVSCMIKMLQEKIELALKVADPSIDDATRKSATEAAAMATKIVVLLARDPSSADVVKPELLAAFEKALGAAEMLHDLCRFSLMSYRRLANDKDYNSLKKTWQTRKEQKPNDYWTGALEVTLLSRGIFDVWDPI